MNDNEDNIKKPIPNLQQIMGNMSGIISGGQDVCLGSEISAPPVTEEMEAAYKEAQRKKAEDAASQSDKQG